MTTRTFSAALSAALLTAVLAGCTPDTNDEISFEDPWIKSTDSDMTSMFGTLHNPGSEPVTLTEVRVAEAGMVELHTIVDDGKGNMVMTAVEGGFVVDPGGVFELEPGAEHIMLMDLHEAIEPGMYVEAELVFDDGQLLRAEVPAKEFLGAEENYDHDSMEHEQG